MINNKSIKRGSIVLCDLPITDTSIQGDIRPAVIVSNDVSNMHCPVVQIVPLTRAKKKFLPVHTTVTSTRHISTALAEQLTVLDKSKIIRVLGTVQEQELENIVKAVKIQLAI